MTKADLLRRMETMPDDAEVQVVYLSPNHRVILAIATVAFLDDTIILLGDPE